jgi:hypothetical protein
MANETGLVLAAPERRWILRELLAGPEPWPITHRNLYRLMIQAEFLDLAGSAGDDAVTEDVEKRMFTALVVNGVSEARARQLAEEEARKPADWKKSKGQAERERRRAFRQAVTASNGALAVTTGLVRTCIICDGPFLIKNGRQPRCDSAYCSDACRQAAYRGRRKQPARYRTWDRGPQVHAIRGHENNGLLRSEIEQNEAHVRHTGNGASRRRRIRQARIGLADINSG